MAKMYRADAETCATCDYWAGEREIKQHGSYVVVESPMTKGECNAPKTGPSGHDHQANHAGCRQHCKWGVLK